ncbi:MAG: DegT/DnrJ/EryC1/StrS family aminotransferase [Gammaproteobacteria bacterium]|nr:DegT/DnrJ/EryC1/StrS family aminotransferase [Gammaproteobacteria bacterium]
MDQKIPYINLSAQWEDEKNDLLPIIENVLRSGQYILGQEVENFETLVKEHFKVKYCVALNSGTDALILGLYALGIRAGDEVITPPNSFIASTSAITHIGAKPVFVDVKPDQNLDPMKIELAITNKTKAIMPVHLTGRVCEMDVIIEIARKNDLVVIEDAAQSAGSKYLEKYSGDWGDIGCFSAHPLKNLNACGDAGFITTDNESISESIKLMANHGLMDRDTVTRFGIVSRMDAIQAAVLSFRIKKLSEVVELRRKNASLYFELLKTDNIFIPPETKDEFNSYHTFVIQAQDRDCLKEHLMKKGIETAIHYPIPIHKQPACKAYNAEIYPNTEKQSKRILTLPIHQHLSSQEISIISQEVNNFYKK